MTSCLKTLSRVILSAIGLAGFAWQAFATPDDSLTWSLKSPVGNCEIGVTLRNGVLDYQVYRAHHTVLKPSQLGLRREDQDFSRDLVFVSAGSPQIDNEDYDLFAGPKPHVHDSLNLRTLNFRNARGALLALDLAASQEGVAFRYRFPETNGAVRVMSRELTGFAVPEDSQGWLQPYHSASAYTPAYEDFYFHVHPGQRPPNSRQKAVGWAFPALFHLPGADTWMLLTESGTDAAYCACHLSPNSTCAVYHLAFPLADESTHNYTNHFGPEPRYPTPWAMPWRVMVLAKFAGDLATETLVTDLAAPSQIADTGWIKPGRASWAWWSYSKNSQTTEIFNQFTDFAAKMGWEYTLFDAGWWNSGIKPLADHALAAGVMPLAWFHASNFYSEASREQHLDEMAAAGVRGLKVDFWCSDRQETIAAQQSLMREAAARHLVVNLHGCTIPRGWQRTWPNFLTCEAVLGSESYLFESRYTQKAAELDTVLPFTRNAVGPMDLTPVACTPQKYSRTTTAAHQLAAALIFTSGIVHYADQPEFFDTLPPEVLKVFRDARARWDETRCLAAEPGKLAVFARHTGNSWFIVGINGSDAPRLVKLDLSPFKAFDHRLVILEGEDALMQVRVAPLDTSKTWRHEMPARGGFILRADQ